MHSTVSARRSRQKAELLARLDKGPRLADVCRAPDMPDARSVSNWARADPAFAEQLAAARLRGRNLRASHYDEALAAAFLARLQSGEPVGSILRDPAMPGRRVYRYWCATQAAFGEEVWRVKRVYQGVRSQIRWDAHRALRHRAWDQATADAIYLRVLRGETIPAVLADLKLAPAAFTRWRREQPELDLIMRKAVQLGPRARGPARAARRCTPELIRRIEHRIIKGASLHSLSREPDMPSDNSLYRWVRERPDFAAAVASACRYRDEQYQDQLVHLTRTAGSATHPRAHAIAKRLGQLNPYPGEKARRRG